MLTGYAFNVCQEERGQFADDILKCGPCKVIAPIYEQLATSETKPGRIAFAKVNVDSAQDVAREYGITA